MAAAVVLSIDGQTVQTYDCGPPLTSMNNIRHNDDAWPREVQSNSAASDLHR